MAGFSGSFVDLYYEIDSFYQGEVHFNITSEVNCTSEEYVEKEIILAAIDGYDDDDDNDNDDGEFLPGPLEVVIIQKKKMMRRLKTILV